jgi:hypothetical protein
MLFEDWGCGSTAEIGLLEIGAGLVMTGPVNFVSGEMRENLPREEPEDGQEKTQPNAI